MGGRPSVGVVTPVIGRIGDDSRDSCTPRGRLQGGSRGLVPPGRARLAAHVHPARVLCRDTRGGGGGEGGEGRGGREGVDDDPPPPPRALLLQRLSKGRRGGREGGLEEGGGGREEGELRRRISFFFRNGARNGAPLPEAWS